MVLVTTRKALEVLREEDGNSHGVHSWCVLGHTSREEAPTSLVPVLMHL